MARLLASSPHTSLPGREPMNPRGRQFALGGTLDTWVRRTTFSTREAAVLRRCYAGRELRTFSRYGIRQWAAPFPATRVVIKDPFAMLSLAAIHDVSGAIPVLLYRHPAAVLASYRRMGWSADTDEIVNLGAPASTGGGDLEAMAAMWRWCHEIALADLDRVTDSVVVSHDLLTTSGSAAQAALFERIGLDLPPASAPAAARVSSETGSGVVRDGGLHDFTRTPDDVANGWRSRLAPDDIEAMERAVGTVWQELQDRQLLVPTLDVGTQEDFS